MTQKEKAKAHEGYCFNSRVSASLALDRKLPEYQPRQCLDDLAARGGHSRLPRASVIFVFVDEDLSVLLRSVHSVLNRSPPELLDGVVLVDDGSDRVRAPWLFEELERHVALLPKTRLFRLGQRAGLMAARVFGAREAGGSTLVFLDTHVECANGWLEPLLDRVAQDRRNVPMPVIGSIDADSFAPRIMGLGMGVLGFHWRLGQKQLPLRSKNCSLLGACPSPIMPGGLFAIDKSWFLDDLDGYDSEMKLYGGEEMEISFKIWQCGGRVELVLCSHVYHVFRSSAFWQGQVYSVPAEVIYRNKLRTADVWMDEYASLVHLSMSPLPPSLPLGDLSAAQAVRERLRCKPFSWYLQEVYPEMSVPNLTGSSAGALRSGYFCVDTLGDRRMGKQLGAFACHGQHGAQALLHSADGLLRLGTEDYEGCAEPGEDDSVLIWPCDRLKQKGIWQHELGTNHRGRQGRFWWVPRPRRKRKRRELKEKEEEAEGAPAALRRRCLAMVTTGGNAELVLRNCSLPREKGYLYEWSWVPPRASQPPSGGISPPARAKGAKSKRQRAAEVPRHAQAGDEL